MPASIQALLAARLDQLPPRERAALERGAVEGQVFHRGAVAALAPDDPEVASRLLGLVRKELVRPSVATLPGRGGVPLPTFADSRRGVRSATEGRARRAARAVRRLAGEHGPRLVELDEILGYHLEQACPLPP